MTRVARGHGLVEILVVLAALAVLMALVLSWLGGRGGKQTAASKVKTPMGRARGVECVNNLSQIRLAFQAAAAGEEVPQDLHSLRRWGLSDQMLRCPQTNRPYRYDPKAGIVRCDTPGHQPLSINLSRGN